jgi:cbb3-type cytochrome oxidase subunit 3
MRQSVYAVVIVALGIFCIGVWTYAESAASAANK